jgi:hypothetical protein
MCYRRAQGKAVLLTETESAPLMHVEALGVQAALTGYAMSAAQLAAFIDKVTVDDVNRVSFPNIDLFVFHKFFKFVTLFTKLSNRLNGGRTLP